MTAPITLERRKGFTPKQRAAVFQAAQGRCHICGGQIQAGQDWDVDHVIPLAMGGSNDPENLRQAHAVCHRGAGSKTSRDVAEIARAVRLHEKHTGARKPRGWGPYRRRMNGTVERIER